MIMSFADAEVTGTSLGDLVLWICLCPWTILAACFLSLFEVVAQYQLVELTNVLAFYRTGIIMTRYFLAETIFVTTVSMFNPLPLLSMLALSHYTACNSKQWRRKWGGSRGCMERAPPPLVGEQCLA